MGLCQTGTTADWLPSKSWALHSFIGALQCLFYHYACVMFHTKDVYHLLRTQTVGVCAPRVWKDGGRVHVSADISCSAVVELGAVVGPGARVGDMSRVGAGSIVGEGVALGARTTLGCVCSSNLSF